MTVQSNAVFCADAGRMTWALKTCVSAPGGRILRPQQNAVARKHVVPRAASAKIEPTNPITISGETYEWLLGVTNLCVSTNARSSRSYRSGLSVKCSYPASHPVDFADRALAHLNKLAEESDSGPLLLRMGVRSGGCSGLSYVMDFEKPENVKVLIASCGSAFSPCALDTTTGTVCSGI